MYLLFLLGFGAGLRSLPTAVNPIYLNRTEAMRFAKDGQTLVHAGDI